MVGDLSHKVITLERVKHSSTQTLPQFNTTVSRANQPGRSQEQGKEKEKKGRKKNFPVDKDYQYTDNSNNKTIVVLYLKHNTCKP